MDTPEQFTCISLCTGYGGIELGLKRVLPGLRTIVYVEREAFAVANLVAKIEQGKMDSAPIWTDVKTFEGRPFRGKVDFLVGGYPCQGESVAGKRLGTADPRWLWPHIARIVQAVEPVWCFFENVPGHLTLGFPAVYRSLRDMGYSVEAGLFTAAEVGAPHKRERLFILAHNTGGGRGTRRSKFQRLQGQATSDDACAVDDAIGEQGRLHSEGRNIGSETRSADKAVAHAEYPEQGQGTGQEPSAESRRHRLTIDRWPARPGQPQYEWEEPRVVDNPVQRRHGAPKGQVQTRRNGAEQPDTGQTQPRMGSPTNGTNNRVDQLRLLGNGVIPQQAEMAFRALVKKQYMAETLIFYPIYCLDCQLETIGKTPYEPCDLCGGTNTRNHLRERAKPDTAKPVHGKQHRCRAE